MTFEDISSISFVPPLIIYLYELITEVIRNKKNWKEKFHYIN